MLDVRNLKAILLRVAILQSLTRISTASTVAIDLDGTCAVLPDATVNVQPVVYSAGIPYNTEISPFGNGYTYTINNAPTVFVVTTHLYTTIYYDGAALDLSQQQQPPVRQLNPRILLRDYYSVKAYKW